MRKHLAVLLLLMLPLSLFGCGNATQGQTPPDGSPQWGITLEAENVTATGLTLLCHQQGGGVEDLATEAAYVLQKRENSEWIDVPATREDICWDAMAYLIKTDGTTRWDVDWENLYGTLPAGEYRIGKSISGAGEAEPGIFYAEFVIE